MSDNDLTCALCAAVFVLILAIMWSWDARACGGYEPEIEDIITCEGCK